MKGSIKMLLVALLFIIGAIVYYWGDIHPELKITICVVSCSLYFGYEFVCFLTRDEYYNIDNLSTFKVKDMPLFYYTPLFLLFRAFDYFLTD